jgi:retrotransposon gag protein/zinc knuckle protein
MSFEDQKQMSSITSSTDTSFPHNDSSNVTQSSSYPISSTPISPHTHQNPQFNRRQSLGPNDINNNYNPRLSMNLSASPILNEIDLTRRNEQGISNNRLIKIRSPPTFSGQPPVTAMQVQSFIRKMDRYLKVVHILPSSLDSKDVSVQFLEEQALIWLDHLEKEQPDIINSWNDLKIQILRRYQPVAQEQLSMNALINVKFKGDVQLFNSEFLSHLQLLPSFEVTTSHKMVMSLYANAIYQYPGAGYLSMIIRQAINNEEVNTIHELQNEALLAEINIGRRAMSNNNPQRRPFIYHNKNYNNNYRNGNNNNFNRKLNFNTPHRLQNMNNDSDYEESNEENNNDEYNNYNDNENNDDHNDSDDDMESNLNEMKLKDSENNDDEDSKTYLNAIKHYKKAKKINSKLSAIEINEYRKNDKCFNCGLPGHYANQCTKPRKQMNNNFNNHNNINQNNNHNNNRNNNHKHVNFQKKF